MVRDKLFRLLGIARTDRFTQHELNLIDAALFEFTAAHGTGYDVLNSLHEEIHLAWKERLCPGDRQYLK